MHLEGYSGVGVGVEGWGGCDSFFEGVQGAPVVVGQDLPGFDVRDGSLHGIPDFI